MPLRAIFGNERPIEIDLGCGKGRFLLARASDHPETNFLGIDRMLRRIRKVDRHVFRADLTNVRLFRMEAYYAVAYLIPDSTISTYYILFPDPWPKKKHYGHRLFNDRFLMSLYRTLMPGGQVHVATDHGPYFEHIQHAFRAAAPCFDPAETWLPAPHEQSDFEQLFSGQRRIGRASFVRRNQ